MGEKSFAGPALIWNCISGDINLWITATSRAWENRFALERDSVVQIPAMLEMTHEFHYHYVRERLSLEIKRAGDYVRALYGECGGAADAHRVPKARDFYVAALEYCVTPCIAMLSGRFDEEMRHNTHQYFSACGGNGADIAASNRHNEREFHAAFGQLKEEWRAQIEIEARKVEAAIPFGAALPTPSLRERGKAETKRIHSEVHAEYLRQSASAADDGIGVEKMAERVKESGNFPMSVQRIMRIMKVKP